MITSPALCFIENHAAKKNMEEDLRHHVTCLKTLEEVIVKTQKAEHIPSLGHKRGQIRGMEHRARSWILKPHSGLKLIFPPPSNPSY